jgi:hypothetical protein
LGYFISAWIASQGVRNSSDADDHLGAGSIKLRASGRLDDFREKITFYNKLIDLDVRLGDLAPALLALGAALAGCVSEWDQLSLRRPAPRPLPSHYCHRPQRNGHPRLTQEAEGVSGRFKSPSVADGIANYIAVAKKPLGRENSD